MRNAIQRIEAFDYPFGYSDRSFLLIDEGHWNVQNEQIANPQEPLGTRWQRVHPKGAELSSSSASSFSTAELLRSHDLDPSDLSSNRRVAVLSSGANGSPARLAKKLLAKGECRGPDRAVIGWLARLHNLDCVYSAHITSYGSVPATLWRSPGTEILVIVLLLTHNQLQRLDRTEALGVNYERLRMTMNLELAAGLHLPCADAYVSIRGALALEHPGNPHRRPTPLAEISGRRRRAQPLGQKDTLQLLYQQHRHQLSGVAPSGLLTMLQKLIRDPKERVALNRQLSPKPLHLKVF